MNTQNNQYLDDCVEAYRDIKEKWLKDFNKSHGTTSKFCKEHGIHGLRRKRSWFILLKRNLVEIESRKKATKLNRTELMEGYVQHKLQKWERKHPCPVKKDDLFYSQQFPVWEAEKNAAEEHIRDLVVAKYDKLPLVGRFKHSDNKFSEQEVAQIKDNGETVKHGGVNNLPESSKVIKMARKETNKVKAKRGNLVCTNLKDHRKKTGRLLLPGANKMRMAA
jgi:hypothetical protein|nr:MAG TPA_asm: hypothetical protein [Caudoviricetes sp.]